MSKPLHMALEMARRNKKKKVQKMADGGILDTLSNAVSKVTKTTSDYHTASDPQAYSDAKAAAPKQDPDPRKRPPNPQFAQGGIVKAKTKSIMRPKMTDSPIIKASLRDEEHAISSMPPKKYDGMSEDKGDIEEAMEDKMEPRLADGGMVDEAVMKENYDDGEDEMDMDHHDSIAAAIMAKRDRMKMMAEGGMVDIDSNEEEQPNDFDKMNEMALDQDYDTDISQPMDSNEDSREIDSDKHDMVSKIRSKMIKRRITGMP